jgi:DNA-binding XRE family transcriptional regulator
VTEFARLLKKWRGKKLQKEAADVIGVNLRTYQGYESGRNPTEFVRREIERKTTELPPT